MSLELDKAEWLSIVGDPNLTFINIHTIINMKCVNAEPRSSVHMT